MRHLLFALLVIVAATSFAGMLDDYYAKQKSAFDWLGVKTEFDTKSEEEYAKDLKKFQAEAEKGSAEAMYRLGRMHEEGRGSLTNDYKAALVWYKKALEKKHPATMNHVATMFMTRQGVDMDFEKAVKLYEEAAKLGNTDAMLNLGVLHEYGLVFKKDYKEAVKLYEKAAEGGNAAALKLLGEVYADEFGEYKGLRDWKKVVPSYEKAAAIGSTEAMVKLGDIYMTSGPYVIKWAKPDQKKAFGLYKKALSRGNGDAAGRIMRNFMKKGSEPDDPEMKRLVEKMAKLWAAGMFGLDQMPGDDEDFEEIGELDLDEHDSDDILYSFYDNYFPLLDEGDYGRDGHWIITLLYEDGGTKFIKERCLTAETVAKWYEKEIQKGNVDAMYELGKLYSGDRLDIPYALKKDNYNYHEDKAIELFTKAAEKGHLDAMCAIGDIYRRRSEYNIAGSKDLEAEKKKARDNKAKAIEWYEKAGEKGSKRGKEEVKELKSKKFYWEEHEIQ